MYLKELYVSISLSNHIFNQDLDADNFSNQMVENVVRFVIGCTICGQSILGTDVHSQHRMAAAATRKFI